MSEECREHCTYHPKVCIELLKWLMTVIFILLVVALLIILIIDAVYIAELLESVCQHRSEFLDAWTLKVALYCPWPKIQTQDHLTSRRDALFYTGMNSRRIFVYYTEVQTRWSTWLCMNVDNPVEMCVFVKLF